MEFLSFDAHVVLGRHDLAISSRICKIPGCFLRIESVGQLKTNLGQVTSEHRRPACNYSVMNLGLAEKIAFGTPKQSFQLGLEFFIGRR